MTIDYNHQGNKFNPNKIISLPVCITLNSITEITNVKREKMMNSSEF